MAKRELTEKQTRFLEVLTENGDGDFRAAMDEAGYSSTTPVSHVISALNDEIIELTKNILAMNGPKAARSIVGVMTSPEDMGAKNKLAAAMTILDRVGVSKKEQIEVTGTAVSGIFILPPKDKPAND
jgi:hypothetical protein